MNGKSTINLATTTGHPVQVVVGWFWQEVADARELSKPPTQIHSIHVLTTEDSLNRHLKLRHEFRADFDYPLDSVNCIIAWLRTLESDRRQGDYESVEEFLEDFGEFLAQPEGFHPAKRKIRIKRF